MTATTLIVGYGNPLRSDDGVGQIVAQAFAGSLACHQLTPELSETLSGVDRAIFVDAAADVPPGSVVVARVTPVCTSHPVMAGAGRPSTSFSAQPPKDVDGGAKPRHDDMGHSGVSVVHLARETGEVAAQGAAGEGAASLPQHPHRRSAPGRSASRPNPARRESRMISGHHATPDQLLALASALYGRSPEAFLVTLGAASLELGEHLSPEVAAAVPEAVAAVQHLLSYAPNPVPHPPHPAG